MLEHDAPFFFVLPDCEQGRVVLRHAGLRGPEVRVISHPSGCPWIAGQWDDEPVVVRRGSDSLAVLGLTSATEPQLHAALDAWGGDEPVELTRSWAGDFHLVASVGGQVWVRGTAYGTRRVFHAGYAGLTVAADRAAALARLLDAPIDRTTLATRLITPTPYPLNDRPMWIGIHAVRPGHHLVLAGAREFRTVRWHEPPIAARAGKDGAPEVRAALERAVRLRIDGVPMVSADLTGGLDSTSLVFLAARHLDPDRLMVCTGSDNPHNCDDLRWARTATEYLPGVRHEVFSGDEQPLFYDGFLDETDSFDAPTPLSLNRERIFFAMRSMARRGSRVHFKGIGGDHLFLGQAAHYHGLLPRHPLLSLHRIRGYRALFSWRWRDLLPALADRRSFRSATAQLDLANTDAVTFSTVLLAWLYPPRVPPWLTPAARDLLADAVAGATGAPPLAANRGEHIELDAIDLISSEMNAWRDISRRYGISIGMPYFDDQVIDAARAVRLQDRSTPFAYKPLLAAAMRGVVPQRMTQRRTKATGEGALNAGLRRQREALASLWDDSVLGGLGLVDTDELRQVSLSPLSKGAAENGLADTVAAELWARTAVAGRGAGQVMCRKAGA